jgi:cation-transporting ATPase E
MTEKRKKNIKQTAEKVPAADESAAVVHKANTRKTAGESVQSKSSIDLINEEFEHDSAAESKAVNKDQKSLTVFTDKNNRNISAYKWYFKKTWKKYSKSQTEPERYKTDISTGLTRVQTEERVTNCFVNYIEKGSTKTVGRILFTNICSFFNLLCFAIGGLLIYNLLRFNSGSPANLLFLVIIFANILIGIVQELKAKYTIEKLSLVAGNSVNVLRWGEKITISPDDVVLDDIIILSLGQQIPADGILCDGVIEVNESLLTGESVPIQKKSGDKLFAGSFVSSGTAKYRCEKIGKENYIQTVAKNASRYIRPKSELLNSLRAVIRAVGGIIILLAALMIISNIFFNSNLKDQDSLTDAITTTAGSIIGMIPAGMFLLTSLALAVGVINLGKSNTLVQELYCIEMLARVDTLCLDKTGTITDGTMKVSDVMEIKSGSDFTLREIISSMLYALDDNNQTSVALQEYFGTEGVIKAKTILPFSSARKLSAVYFEGEGTYIMGAPEYVIKDMPEKLGDKIVRFASQGYRVLVIGYSAGKINGELLPQAVKPVALITIQDNVRREAPNTIKWFRDNGVDIRIISGDNPITVSEVAKRAGVVGAEKYISLAGLSVAEVRATAREYNVFGRVSPEQKLILIKELKNAGRTVAMTGDGVNDILALREADCSIAMATGSEAARNVSHLVLLDSNFASMPKVVLEGRRVVNNVQKSSSLFLFKTLFTIMLTVFCLGVTFTTGKFQAYFFEPRHLLLLEYFVIGIPCFALALERSSALIKGKFIFNILRNAFSGALIVIINLIVLYLFNVFGILEVTGSITDDTVFKTMCILVVVITGFSMLFRVAKPFNVYRGTLLCIMVTLVIISVYYLQKMFGIEQFTQFTPTNILLLIVMAQFSFMLVPVIDNLFAKIKIESKENL